MVKQDARLGDLVYVRSSDIGVTVTSRRPGALIIREDEDHIRSLGTALTFSTHSASPQVECRGVLAWPGSGS